VEGKLTARGVVFLLLCVGSAASAQPATQSTDPPVTEEGGDAPTGPALADDARLKGWPWAISVPLLGIALTIEFTVDVDGARWTGAGRVDKGFRSWVRDSHEGRERADLASDVFLYAMFAAPVLDATLWRNGPSPSRDTYRLLTADALAFSMETLVVVATKVAFRRARPYDRGCRGDPDYSGGCESDSRYRGFISGHTTAAFTGASLVCAHQRLRGQSPLGRVECVASLLLASLTGAMRIVAEKHYFADVATGALVGFLSGFLVPLYVYPRELPRPEPPPRVTRTGW
jgi:membrane-associated phospholipid phosphatase